MKTGWTLGGGGEWLLDGYWSIKAAAFTQTMVIDADLKAQLARVGLNYRY